MTMEIDGKMILFRSFWGQLGIAAFLKQIYYQIWKKKKKKIG